MSMGRMEKPNLLRNTRVYLSGPMDFVASREVEKEFGWRNRVSEFLQEFGVTVFDPKFWGQCNALLHQLCCRLSALQLLVEA